MHVDLGHGICVHIPFFKYSDQVNGIRKAIFDEKVSKPSTLVSILAYAKAISAYFGTYPT